MTNPAEPPPARRHPHRESIRWSSVIASAAALMWIAVVNSSLQTYWHSSSPNIRSLVQSRTITSDLDQRYYLRNRLSRTEQYEQWKTKRKQAGGRRFLVDKVKEWEDDDDDDDDTVSFHLQDDDATNNSNATSPTKGQEKAVTNNSNAAVKETGKKRGDSTPNNKKGMGKQTTATNKEEGIIYSDKTGSKESTLLPKRPPPPPLPPPKKEEKNDVNTIDNVGKEERGQSSNNTDIAKDEKGGQNNEDEKNNNINTSNTNNIHNKNNNNNQEHEQQQSNQSISTSDGEEDEMGADTIFDDLLRGFTFALLFSTLLYTSYKCCWYTCVRFGIFPDERIMEARFRRMRLKRKKSYNNGINSNDDSDRDATVPPLDTRLWGEWMAKRNTVGKADGDYYSGGVWDTAADTWDDDDSIGVGAIVFDNGGVEMAVWDNEHDEDAMSEMELEYGEGDELEDKSHDSRMFDDEDGGKGMEQEANTFFKGKNQNQGQKGNVKKQVRKVNHGGSSDNDGNNGQRYDASSGTFDKKDILSISFNQHTSSDAGLSQSDSSVDSFFDALQQPSATGKIDDAFSLDSLPAYPAPSKKDAATKKTSPNDDDDDVDLRSVGNNSSNPKEDNTSDNDDEDGDGDYDRNAEGFSNSMLFQDNDDYQGYDEETDLLGLRSDSPPPLDLEEMSRIEKKLKEDMENAKLY